MSNDLLAALLIGFLGSGHCLVMCGGIAGALQLAMPVQSTAEKFLLQLALSAGRLTTYAVFGAIVGYGGVSAMQLTGASMLWLRLVAGILLIMMALYISRLWFGLLLLEKAGQKLWQYVQPVSRRFLPLDSIAKAYAYGMCWGALPCGLVYSALGWSLASGSVSAGAVLMLAFGLGTLPAILLTGSAAQLMNKIKRHTAVRYSAAAMLAIYGSYTIWLAIKRMVF
ncbi:sulfite exporter TauE/SafE family protein [Rheinheimera oceanensis]|uniref:sulfite exporter TauE/SafE family protein n=1 Tax=Rheinheimera oceanensis TaxID=2817449 RepID=UPI001BFD5CCA|nr:sulfite exporter TauE/SafE family protein [Rheinheimera oceanensis]